MKETSVSRDGASTFEELAAALPSLEGDWEYVLEGLKIDIAMQVTAAMKAAGVSGAELARRMEVTPPMVNRMLRHTGNVQLQTLAKVAVALGLDPAFRLIGKDQEVVVRNSAPLGEPGRVITCVPLPSAEDYMRPAQSSRPSRVVELAPLKVA